MAGFRPWLLLVLAAGPGAVQLTSPSSRFLMCERRPATSTSQGCREKRQPCQVYSKHLGLVSISQGLVS